MPYDFDAAASVIGRQIVARLAGSETELRQRWLSAFPVRHFFIDDLLPELWTAALDRPMIIESRCNRLFVMATDDTSWHSVSG
jgi:hypothetical protein